MVRGAEHSNPVADRLSDHLDCDGLVAVLMLEKEVAIQSLVEVKSVSVLHLHPDAHLVVLTRGPYRCARGIANQVEIHCCPPS